MAKKSSPIQSVSLFAASSKTGSLPVRQAGVSGGKARKFFTKQHETALLPNLIEVQINSYRWFLEKGLKELLGEINPIKDFTGKNLELNFG